MSKWLLTAFAATVLVAMGGSALADGSDNSPPYEGAAQRARTTSFIWFSKVEEFSAQNGKFKEALVKNDMKELAVYPGLGGALISAGADEVRRVVEEEELFKLAKVEIQENAVVSSFDSGCQILGDVPQGQEKTPWGVQRIAPNPQNYTGTAAVWIVDSGISSDYDGQELNVVSRRYCPEIVTGEACPPANGAAQARDDIGHGTMLAGIIGARGGNEYGVVGVAPWAPLNALRVFDGTDAKTNLDRVITALLWIENNAVEDNNNTTPTPGDVINISLGLRWNPLPESGQRRLEGLIHSLADAGFKIAIAAGNTDTLVGQSYVQTISPARAGAYRAKQTKSGAAGVVMTASATDEQNRFWSFSAFGNYLPNTDGTKTLSLPDFAEPGDAIVSLWPNQSLASCSGTSFAAAHLAGLLLVGSPHADATAAQADPSAAKPDGQFDPNLLDPIGVR